MPTAESSSVYVKSVNPLVLLERFLAESNRKEIAKKIEQGRNASEQ